MRTQIGWADKGVREARAKATDNDKHILHRQVARSEKLAGKVKATERMLDRLDVVAELGARSGQLKMGDRRRARRTRWPPRRATR